MDIYSELKLSVAPGKVEPDVWVRRMVIYRQITPKPDIIRDIPFTKGVNIVWAEESENEAGPDEITGHSAGKTSFCRLLRYALGEKNFGTKANMSLIQRAFPSGYLGAELVVRQQQWAIIRPLGQGVASYARPGVPLEVLLQEKSKPVSQDEYPKVLGLDGLVDFLDAGAVLRTNRPIQWGHLLAWCARDQETRFQNCHDWRSPRSDSETPSFRSSKADPLFVMRIVLGLFLPEELRGEEELATQIQLKEDLEKKLPELRREPQFRINLYDQELRNRLRLQFPQIHDINTIPFQQSDLFQPSLDRLTDNIKERFETEINDAEGKKSKAESDIEDLGGRISVLSGRLHHLNTMFNVDNAAGKEAEQGAAQREQERKDYDQHGDKSCYLGGILYRDCPQVQDRQQSLNLVQFQDAQALAKAAARKAESQRLLEDQKAQIQKQIASLQDQRKEIRKTWKILDIDIQRNKEILRDLLGARNELTKWIGKANAPGGYEDVDECKRILKETDERIEALKSQLNDLLTQHDVNRKLLSSIFSAVVRSVLPKGGYDGQVSLADRELSFHITRGTAMSGEAVETLAVLLADVSCMVYNSVSDRPRLPGFLLHDSPREADLSLRLYRHFISLIASLQVHFGSAENCPFQYIITTTTPPPDKLKSTEWVKLHLNAAVPEELLFRQNLAIDQEAIPFRSDTVKGDTPQ